MKFSTLLTLLILIGCSQEEPSPIQKAELSLKNHLSAEGVKDYKAIQTKLDSFYATYTVTKEGSVLLHEYNAVKAENKDIYSPHALFLATKEMALQDTLKARTARFGHRFSGWQAVHTYQFKDEKGMLTEKLDTFLLNQDYQLMKADTISL